VYTLPSGSAGSNQIEIPHFIPKESSVESPISTLVGCPSNQKKNKKSEKTYAQVSCATAFEYNKLGKMMIPSS
jgi:hypothetical protein